MHRSDWDDFKKSYGELASRYGKGSGADTIQTDFEDLQGFSLEVVQVAMVEARRTSRFFPKPADLIPLCFREQTKRQAAVMPHPNGDLPQCRECGAVPEWHKYYVTPYAERRKAKPGEDVRQIQVERFIVRHGEGRVCDRLNFGRDFV